jgi:carboxypeptidase family protein
MPSGTMLGRQRSERPISAGANVMVVPAGTFRLTGRVLVGGTPLAGATVSITSGTGTGATTTTDSDGQYRLYGVAGVVQVQIVDLKYISLQQSVTVSNNTVADFTLTPSPTPPAPSPPSPTPPNQPTGGYELTGVVIGDDGRVLSGATIHVNFFGSSGASTVADSAGRYDVSFNAPQGRYLEGATALVFVEADGYENEFRWFRPTSAAGLQTLDIHPRAIRQITAGESTSVTVTPDDTPCINNAQDFPGLGPDYFCRTVRIVASSSGVVTIEAVAQDGQPRPQLETEFTTASGEDVGNPRVMSVTAGQVVKASIELLAGLPAQTFELKTSIAAPRGMVTRTKTGTSGPSGPRNALPRVRLLSCSEKNEGDSVGTFLGPDVPDVPVLTLAWLQAPPAVPPR